MTHTPGPWTISPYYTGGINDDASGFHIKAGANGRYLFDVREMPGQGKQANFNLRLIAAAPLMLEALKEARGAVEQFAVEEARGNKVRPGGPSYRRRDQLARIDAAIAAATGEGK